MDWRHEAACREVDPELFFPIGNSGPALLQIDEAKQVCRRCSVMDECLRWAIDSGPGRRRLGRDERGRAAHAQAPDDQAARPCARMTGRDFNRFN